MADLVKLIECPRDAWQGLKGMIPAELKVDYLKALISVGFKHIDAVSFVSPKHVKQMADSEGVMAKLNAFLPLGTELPEIIGIVVNEKGLERALASGVRGTGGRAASADGQQLGAAGFGFSWDRLGGLRRGDGPATRPTRLRS